MWRTKHDRKLACLGMEELTPHIEEATALQLYPTYAYFRVFRRGDVLARHKDRPCCEISLTLNLGFQAERLWPIWIEGPVVFPASTSIRVMRCCAAGLSVLTGAKSLTEITLYRLFFTMWTAMVPTPNGI